jgi:hypothetical protein
VKTSSLIYAFNYLRFRGWRVTWNYCSYITQFCWGRGHFCCRSCSFLFERGSQVSCWIIWFFFGGGGGLFCFCLHWVSHLYCIQLKAITVCMKVIQESYRLIRNSY